MFLLVHIFMYHDIAVFRHLECLAEAHYSRRDHDDAVRIVLKAQERLFATIYELCERDTVLSSCHRWYIHIF